MILWTRFVGNERRPCGRGGLLSLAKVPQWKLTAGNPNMAQPAGCVHLRAQFTFDTQSDKCEMNVGVFEPWTTHDEISVVHALRFTNYTGTFHQLLGVHLFYNHNLDHNFVLWSTGKLVFLLNKRAAVSFTRGNSVRLSKSAVLYLAYDQCRLYHYYH